MIFEIPGKPIAKMRHRLSTRNGHAVSYDPQDAEKKMIRGKLARLTQQKIDDEILPFRVDCSFLVEFEFHMTPAPSLSRREHNRTMWLKEPAIKPDIDNLVKFYLDAANGVLWHDDAQIIEINAKKFYSEIPKTIIKVHGIKPMSVNEKIEGILGIFSPDHYHEMLKDIRVLAALESIPNRNQRERAADAAYVLSKFADGYADDLKKIKKCYPGHWQDQIQGTTKMVNIPPEDS